MKPWMFHLVWAHAYQTIKWSSNGGGPAKLFGGQFKDNLYQEKLIWSPGLDPAAREQ